MLDFFVLPLFVSFVVVIYFCHLHLLSFFSSSSSTLSPVSSTLDTKSLRYVVAPMVGASDLAFRLLTRKYGATLCYTAMFYSDRFVADAEYRERVFQTLPADRPLVVQFAANRSDTLVAAAKLVQERCDAVDINLGCPTNEAKALHYGSYLLDPCDRMLVLEMVQKASELLKVPVFCKIRLLESVEATVTFAKDLERHGCKMLVVHGRRRGNPGNRRQGAADLSTIRAIKQAVKIPVVANGNVRAWRDVIKNLSVTGCDGIMSAEEVLRNPALFLPSRESDQYNSPNEVDSLTLAIEYISLAATHKTALTWVIRHVKYIAEGLLGKYQVLDEVLDARTNDDILHALKKCQVRQANKNYLFDHALHARQKSGFSKLAQDRDKREQNDRRLYGPLTLSDNLHSFSSG